jgi:hypothetical protein
VPTAAWEPSKDAGGIGRAQGTGGTVGDEAVEGSIA